MRRRRRRRRRIKYRFRARITFFIRVAAPVGVPGGNFEWEAEMHISLSCDSPTYRIARKGESYRLRELATRGQRGVGGGIHAT